METRLSPTLGVVATHLPHAYVCRRVGEGTLEHVTHLEGIRVNFGDVVQDHQNSSQGVDAGEEADVTEQQEQLQEIVKCSLRDAGGGVILLLLPADLREAWPCSHQIGAHVGLQADLLGQGKLLAFQTSPLLHLAEHLLVASPLQPVRQEGLHELIQDLTGDQQGGQTLNTRRKRRLPIFQTQRLAVGSDPHAPRAGSAGIGICCLTSCANPRQA